MTKLENMLRASELVTDYKINTHQIKSYELFFVKGKLETVRTSSTCDTKVTVYVSHGEFLGDADFLVYPSTTDEELSQLIEKAAAKAKLIQNKPYALPENETGDYMIASNLSEAPAEDLTAAVAAAVFQANTLENGSLNSVEIFLYQHHETIINSRGIRKSGSL